MGSRGVRRGWLGVTWLLMAVVWGCGARQNPTPAVVLPELTRPTVLHRVAAGETLWAIGQRYGVSYREIARVNGLADPSRIFIGQELTIPELHVAATRGAAERRGAAAGTGREEPAPEFVWPVRDGRVSSGFGPRGGRRHQGIDIAAPEGTAIYAAAPGEVVFSGRLSGYGKVLIVGHGGGYVTVYAHNRRHLVLEGERVEAGQRIAEVGRTGRVTGSNLHFEIRRADVPVDPLAHLDSSGPDEDVVVTRRDGSAGVFRLAVQP